MQRRSFLATAAAPLGQAVLNRSSRRSPAGPARRQRGILLRVRVPDALRVPDGLGWQPRTWRDVPPAPFAVDYRFYGPTSLAECRKLAKQHNQEQLQLGVCSWMIVVATDGRLASVKGGA